MSNPFMIRPGSDFGAGLQSLARGVDRYGQIQKQEKAQEKAQGRAEEVKAAMQKAYASGDPKQIMQVAIDYPEAQKTAEMLFGFTNDQTKQIAKNTYQQVLTDPENAKMHLDGGIQAVAAAGGNPLNMVKDYAMFTTEPEAALKKIEAAFAGIDPEGYKVLRGDPSKSAKVQSSDILPDGTTIQVMSDGETVVTSPEGQILEGEERTKAIKDAQDFGIDVQSRREGGRTESRLEAELKLKPKLKERIVRAEQDAKAATGQIKEYFGQLSNIERNIANYDEAIKLIDQGADTGVIASRMPSVRAASIKLDNMRNTLGLDVVGNTTFGALSEAELNMALDTAMPKGLDGPELKKWFEDKKAAQQKMADYISNAIQFLNIPGNSLADLQASKPKQKTVVRTGTSNGRKVVQYDDGSIEYAD